MKEIARRVSLVLSLLLFAVSLTQAGFYSGDSRTVWGPGWYLFLIGPFGMMDLEFTWFANPLLITAWAGLFLRAKKLSLVSGALCSAMMLGFLLRKKILVDEGGGHALIVGYGVGYWMWILSAFFALLSGVLTVAKPKRMVSGLRCDRERMGAPL